LNHVNKAPQKIDSDRRALTLVDRRDSAFDGASQMERDSVRGLGCPQALAFGLEVSAKMLQLHLERLSY
jgi:hypothetical protein